MNDRDQKEGMIPLPPQEQVIVNDHERLAPHLLFEIIRKDGEEELARPARALIFSGLAAGLVIAFSSDGTYKLDVGNYQSEGFGTGLLSFTSVNSTLTKATATWGYKGYYTDNNENIVYENVVSQTVKIDTGASGDDLITVDLGFGDGAMDFTYLYN